MKPTLHLVRDDIPKVIANSVRAVLKAHDRTLAQYNDDDQCWAAIDEKQLDDLLREIGNNATAALQSIDTNPENL